MTEEDAYRILQERLRSVVPKLGPEERSILEYRFGLKDGQSRPLKEVAARFSITTKEIRELEASTLKLLRHPDLGG